MDYDAEPLFQCLKQFLSNDRFFSFLAIVKDTSDIQTFMNYAEADASVKDLTYKFEFFLEAYTQSYLRFASHEYMYYKYHLRYLLYDVQTNSEYARCSFINFPRKGQYQTEKLIAAGSFYYMIFYSFESTINFLKSLSCTAATSILNLFLEGSFFKIVQILSDLWYMPVTKFPPMIQILNLEKINGLSRIDQNKFNQEVRRILGLEGSLNNVLNKENKSPGNSPSQISVDKVLNDSIKIRNPASVYAGCNQYIIKAAVKEPPKVMPEPPPFINKGSLISRHFLSKQSVNDSIEFNTSINSLGDCIISPRRTTSRFVNDNNLFKSEFQSDDSRQTLKAFLNIEMNFTNEQFGPECYSSPITQRRPQKFDYKDNSNATLDEDRNHTISALNKSFSNGNSFIEDSIENISLSNNYSTPDMLQTVKDQHNRGYSQIPFVCANAIREKFKNTPKKVVLYTWSLDKSEIEEEEEEKEEEDIVEQSVVCINKTFSENVDNFRYGKYKLLKLIGSGSFSKVFEAEVDGDNKRYAVKVLKFDKYQPKESIINEINIMKIMNTTGRSIYMIENHISLNGAIIVMEKASTDMKKFYAEHIETADRYFVLHYWRSMIYCVHALHQKNIAHLDLKLQNFVVTDNHFVKLIDYGISRLVPNDCEIIDSDSVGTIVFMSPELLLNEGQIRPFKCDIWSMGIVLYTMVFDRQPVFASTYEEYVEKLIENDCQLEMPESPRNCDLIIELMRHSIIRNPEYRYETIDLFDLMDRWMV